MKFETVKKLFQDEANKLIPNYDKVVDESYSSERCGGWIIKDTTNTFIGWVGNRGDIKVYDYVETTSENVHQIDVR